MPMSQQLKATLETAVDRCDCFVAWLNKDYFESEYCKAELLHAKRLGKLILPFGNFSDVQEFLTGELEFLRRHFITNHESMSFFEVRHIDETLFEFEKIAVC